MERSDNFGQKVTFSLVYFLLSFLKLGHYIAQAGPKFLGSGDLPTSDS